MTGTELEALRRLLFFSRPEAAVLVGQSSERAWNFWERGDRAVPRDVADLMVNLADWRIKAIRAARYAIQEAPAGRGEPESIALVWYATQIDWMSLEGREPHLWRPHCSVIASLLASEPLANLVEFDGPAYSAWLAGREDSETMRSQWAGRVAPHNGKFKKTSKSA
jgi:hypothetical protein